MYHRTFKWGIAFRSFEVFGISGQRLSWVHGVIAYADCVRRLRDSAKGS